MAKIKDAATAEGATEPAYLSLSLEGKPHPAGKDSKGHRMRYGKAYPPGPIPGGGTYEQLPDGSLVEIIRE